MSRTFDQHNNIIVLILYALLMIPDFITYPGCLWPLLPPGIHDSDMDEIYKALVYNERRKHLFEGLKLGLHNMFQSGSRQVFLDGSYVTAKPFPNDYEVCWDPAFVDLSILDPVFLLFDNQREAQKLAYGGEYFPSIMEEGFSGKPFLEFFQKDKATGNPKGIIRIENYLLKRRDS